MSEPEKITESLIGEHITRAVSDVFRTMLGRSIVPVSMDCGGVDSHGRDSPDRMQPGVLAMVGQVGFVGEINGFTYLCLEEAFAKDCVGGMLGLDARELAALSAETIKDAVGELANMTVGSFKSGLSEAGFRCKLTIPSVLSVTDFCIVTPLRWAHRYVYVFDSHGQRVVVDVLVKI